MTSLKNPKNHFIAISFVYTKPLNEPSNIFPYGGVLLLQEAQQMTTNRHPFRPVIIKTRRTQWKTVVHHALRPLQTTKDHHQGVPIIFHRRILPFWTRIT